MEAEDNLYMDKIKLSAIAVDKEGQLIGEINDLLRIREEYGYPDERLSKEHEYHIAWGKLAELYDFLRYNKIEGLKNKKGMNEKYNKLNDIMRKKRTNYLSVTIIDLLDAYLSQNRLNVRKISRGNAWFDLGTAENLLIASQFVHSIQTRQGQLVGSPEEASFNAQLIDNEHFHLVAQKFEQNDYGKNLFNILET